MREILVVNRKMVILLHSSELDSAFGSSFRVVAHVPIYLDPVFWIL